jgi:hypothetical protein
MARNFASYNYIGYVNSAAPKVLVAFQAATNIRAVIHTLEVMPRGSTPGSAPLRFAWVTAADTGALTDDSSLLRKRPIVGAETLQTKVWKRVSDAAAEPGTQVIQWTFSLHQQGSREWREPTPYREILIPGGGIWGLSILDVGITVDLAFALEE